MRTKNQILEEYMVMAARAGDKSALQRLVALRTPRMLAHAHRLLGDEEEARDALQEAWLEIIRHLDKLKQPRAFRAWATRILTRQCARTIQKKVRQRSLKRDVELFETQKVATNEGELMADASALAKAISDLPKDQAATIALFYLDEMSVTEVAVALDIPVGTAKTRLMHAREKLKTALKGELDE